MKTATTTIGQLVTKKLETINPSSTAQEAAKKMRDKKVSSLVVTLPFEDKPIGIVTERDLVRQVCAKDASSNAAYFVSLLFAIFAQFKTAIQLGAGWKITKIGGMLGINHTVSHNKIATGIKSGILDKILFPDNIIRDAASVIANFETVFPTLKGQNIFGPAIQIAYGTPTLIAADVAVILEFPSPFLLSILGKVTSKLPNKDDPVIQINIGILGALDIVKGKAETYGSLYDSKILGYPLLFITKMSLFPSNPFFPFKIADHAASYCCHQT